MISALLYFVLGFAVAALFAIIIAPIAVRRAVVLTRRQVEAHLPLSLDEIRAEKDKVRAELAMDIRRLEMDRDAANRARVRHEVKTHQAEELKREAFTARDEALAEFKVKQAELSETLDKLTIAQQDIAERDTEIAQNRERIAALDADLSAANTQIGEFEIEIAAAIMAREDLQSNLNVTFGERKELEMQLRDLRTKLKATQTDMREANRDKTDAEKRLARIEKRAAMLEEKLLSRKASTPSTKRTTREPEASAPVVVKKPKAATATTPKAGDITKLDPKKNSLLQSAKEPDSTKTQMPKAAPLTLGVADKGDKNAQSSASPTAHFDDFKDELEAIGEGKTFDRDTLEAQLLEVAATMSASAIQEEGMEDILSTFEKRAKEAPEGSLARQILDAHHKD